MDYFSNFVSRSIHDSSSFQYDIFDILDISWSLPRFTRLEVARDVFTACWSSTVGSFGQAPGVKRQKIAASDQLFDGINQVAVNIALSSIE